MFSNSNGTFSAWNQGANSIYLNKITGVAGVVITTIKSGWASNINTEASTNTVYIFSDSSGAPGSVAATFTYSSNDGASLATYTGSYTVPAGKTFFIGQRATAFIHNAGGSTANQAATTWSITYANRYSGTSLAGPFTNDAVGSAPIWLIYGSSTTTLSTPANPVVSSTSTSVAVSEISTVANASNYLINLYASDGITVLDSRTVTPSAILTNTIFTGLNPNTNYKVAVTALGDGVSYSNSALSGLSSITTNLGPTSVSLSIVGNPITASYRTTYQIKASVTGSTGYVTFTVNSKNLPACRKITLLASVALCNWKAIQIGLSVVNATFTSTDLNYSNSTALPYQIFVGRRTNLR